MLIYFYQLNRTPNTSKLPASDDVSKNFERFHIQGTRTQLSPITEHRDQPLFGSSNRLGVADVAYEFV